MCALYKNIPLKIRKFFKKENILFHSKHWINNERVSEMKNKYIFYDAYFFILWLFYTNLLYTDLYIKILNRFLRNLKYTFWFTCHKQNITSCCNLNTFQFRWKIMFRWYRELILRNCFSFKNWVGWTYSSILKNGSNI